ncbi:hypothetical protein TYRP_020728, partial [Tyrophagus putrescentiae]
FGQRLTLTTLGHCERPPTRAPLAPLARPESVDVHSAQVSSDLAALGSTAHPGVTWLTKNALLLGPRSLRSRDPRRRSLTTAKSRQISPPWARHCFPCNSGAPPAAQGKNGSDNAQPKSQDFTSPFWAVLPPHQQCFPANSEQRQQRALRERQRERTVLSSAAAAAIASRACAQLPKPAKHRPKQRTTFQTFWVF